MRSQVGLRKHHYKASGCDGIPVEPFQILKDDAVKVLHSTCQKIWKTQQWLEKVSFHSNSNERQWQCSNYYITVLISRASKVLLKILQARLQQYMNRESLDVHTGFRKGRGTRDQIDNICWIIKKARVPENIYFCFIDYTKPFDCVGHQKL